jgi:hypothetical protein
MTTRSTRTLPGWTMLRSLVALVLATGALLATVAVSGATPAGAAPAGGSVTYSSTVTIGAPPPSNFAGSGGGDGWAVAMTPTQVFNVFHHQASLTVACHEQSDASACWLAPKTVTDGSGNNFSTSIGPGLYVDPVTSKLYVYVVRTSDSTAGVACIDTTQPTSATGDQLFCGFTALSAVGGANASPSSLSAPVQVGINWYSYDEVVGGTSNGLLCFNLVTDTACASQPFAVNYGGLPQASYGYSFPIGSAGTDVFIQAVSTTLSELACFDTITKSSCAGSWPITVAGANGSPFPMLSSTGSVAGICLPINTDPCFDLTGASGVTPPGMTAAIGSSVLYNGPAITLGARVYVANANTGSVGCYDFTSQASCANFPKTFSGLSLLYTVDSDPQRPSCIWVNADSGASQIQNFDAYTGGPCGAGSVRVLAQSIVAPYDACIPANYTSLQILSPTRDKYASGDIQFLDFDGNPIPGQADGTLDGTGSISLSSLNLASKSPLPQFLITLNGTIGQPSQVVVRLTWTGSLSDQCTLGGQQVLGNQGYRLAGSDGGVFSFGTSGFHGSMAGQQLNAKVVGIAASATDGGYWLVGADGGIFAFGDAGFHGSAGGSHLNAPVVGIARTPSGNGYWLVGADGGIFAYGDAGFYGSHGGAHLNAPVVGIAPTPSGNGYWLVAADGGVFAYGDAGFHGSQGGTPLNAPVVGIASSSSGKGYWLVAADGGIFAFGDAPFEGSASTLHLSGPVRGMVPTSDGQGYWVAAADGGVFALGDANFFGSASGQRLGGPIVGVAG